MSEPVYFDTVEVGFLQTAGPYELGADEIIAFARQYDPNPIHTDPKVAEKIFGSLIASGPQLLAIATRMSHDCERPYAVIAGLGYTDLVIPNPGRAGDTLFFSTEVIAKEASKSRPDRGRVTVQSLLTNRDGDTVLSYQMAVLMRCQPSI